MVALLAWLLLALPQWPPGAALYPPDQVIVLHRSPEFRLRWRLPGTKFRATLHEGERLKMTSTLSQSEWKVPVRPGAPYTWTVTPLQEVPPKTSTHHFRVAPVLEYHSRGRDGGPGETGSSGGQVQAELRRDEAGMNLFVTERKRTLHYLFTEPGSRFLISARGGLGGAGVAGKSFKSLAECVGGRGGAGGWGGSVRIITHTVPWRQYLDVDVSAGTPGEGGMGGEYYNDEDLTRAPDGSPGQPGRAGTIQTVIEAP
jgi:hypothetical protein